MRSYAMRWRVECSSFGKNKKNATLELITENHVTSPVGCARHPGATHSLKG